MSYHLFLRPTPVSVLTSLVASLASIPAKVQLYGITQLELLLRQLLRDPSLRILASNDVIRRAGLRVHGALETDARGAAAVLVTSVVPARVVRCLH